MLFAGTIRIGKSDTDSEHCKVICQLVDITAIKGIKGIILWMQIDRRSK